MPQDCKSCGAEKSRTRFIFITKRPHISCDYVTPVLAHKQQKHKPKFYSRLLTNKHILTKQKRLQQKAENSSKKNLLCNRKQSIAQVIIIEF